LSVARATITKESVMPFKAKLENMDRQSYVITNPENGYAQDSHGHNIAPHEKTDTTLKFSIFRLCGHFVENNFFLQNDHII
jgi:hypothetical protein